MIKLQNSIKRIEFPFFMEVNKSAPQYAIHDLQKAFHNAWDLGKNYPKYKKKGVKDSFRAIQCNSEFKQFDFKIHLPRIGKVRCAENLRFDGKINYVTIKRIADKWFASISVEILEETPVYNENQVITGVDVGIKNMITTSDGRIFKNPRALRINSNKLKRCHRALSRKQKGSNNRKKQRIKLAKLLHKIFCIRRDAAHKATTEIVANSDIIILEYLKVANMMKNKNLAQSIADVSFREIRRQIEYKAVWAGKTVVIADTYFPSSKTCSCCGWKNKDLKLSDRVFKCRECDNVMDRDLNAAINLKNYGTVGYTGSDLNEVKACGEGSSLDISPDSLSEKQEID